MAFRTESLGQPSFQDFGSILTQVANEWIQWRDQTWQRFTHTGHLWQETIAQDIHNLVTWTISEKERADFNRCYHQGLQLATLTLLPVAGRITDLRHPQNYHHTAEAIDLVQSLYHADGNITTLFPDFLQATLPPTDIQKQLSGRVHKTILDLVEINLSQKIRTDTTCHKLEVAMTQIEDPKIALSQRTALAQGVLELLLGIKHEPVTKTATALDNALKQDKWFTVKGHCLLENLFSNNNFSLQDKVRFLLFHRDGANGIIALQNLPDELSSFIKSDWQLAARLASTAHQTALEYAESETNFLGKLGHEIALRFQGRPGIMTDEVNWGQIAVSVLGLATIASPVVANAAADLFSHLQTGGILPNFDPKNDKYSAVNCLQPPPAPLEQGPTRDVCESVPKDRAQFLKTQKEQLLQFKEYGCRIQGQDGGDYVSVCCREVKKYPSNNPVQIPPTTLPSTSQPEHQPLNNDSPTVKQPQSLLDLLQETLSSNGKLDPLVGFASVCSVSVLIISTILLELIKRREYAAEIEELTRRNKP